MTGLPPGGRPRPAFRKLALQRIFLALLGLTLSFALLEIGLRLGGWGTLYFQNHPARTDIDDKKTYRILCLGESTTVVPSGASYPLQLEKILNDRDTGLRFIVVNRGFAGATTSQLLDRLEYDLNKYRPDMCITMMGINDEETRPETERGHPVGDFIGSSRTYKFVRFVGASLFARIRRSDWDRKIEMPPIEPSPEKTADRDALVETAYDHLRKEEFGRAEKAFLQALQQAPDDPAALEGLGETYRLQEKFPEAENVFRKMLRQNPNDERALLALAKNYAAQEKPADAQEAFREVLRRNPGQKGARLGLARAFRDQGRLSEAEKNIREVLRRDPADTNARVELAKNYQAQGRNAEAEKLFREIIGRNRDRKNFFPALLDFFKTETTFLETLILQPNNAAVHLGLARHYCGQGKFEAAEKVCRDFLRRDPLSVLPKRFLAVIYLQTGRLDMAAELWEEINRRLDYPDVTKENYRKLRATLAARDIRYVCVQYPMRPIAPLKKIFESTAGITFVDNESVFKQAVQREGSSPIFSDQFAGDFGHATPRGNRLLAENVADAVLRALRPDQ